MEDGRNSYVGGVIVNYESSAQLRLCLTSLLRARNTASLRLFVLDNGSTRPEAARCEALCREMARPGALSIEYSRSDENLGFSGGNNIGIRHFLADEACSHVVLLNADVVVAEGWLDRLLSCNGDLAGPVSNAGGGFQTVFGDNIPMDDDAIDAVQAVARRRAELYGAFCAEARMLSFFAVLIRRQVFDKIGLLDERFYPGQFEDDDFCLRAAGQGFTMKVARGCYLHHWGGQSFAAAGSGSSSFDANHARFIEKWQAPHTPRESEIYESAILDLGHLADRGLLPPDAAAEAAGALRYAQQDRENLLHHYEALAARLGGAGSINGYPELPAAQLPRQLWHKLKRIFARPEK